MGRAAFTLLLVGAFVLLSLAAECVHAAQGADISEPLGQGNMNCAKSHGWDFIVVRSYCSFGGTDPNVHTMLDQAKSAGIPNRDIYHFPCRSVDPAKQVNDDINNVGKGNFDSLWFDIETNPSPGCGWSGDLSSNCEFLKTMIDTAKGAGVSVGVYASSYMWSSIMGNGCTAGSSEMLWYAHYDDVQSFSDFTPFGGWKSPTRKQYWDSVSICGIDSSADADWHP